jgi:EpsI family protein
MTAQEVFSGETKQMNRVQITMHAFLKPYIVIALISFTFLYCLAVPEAKYISSEVSSHIKIPYEIHDWQGIDIKNEWNLEEEEFQLYGQVLEREYTNGDKKNIFLTILDAHNFHNPKVCSNSTGFKVRELDEQRFHIKDFVLKTNALHIRRDAEGFFLIYWICIDEAVVDWTKQKMKLLYSSLVNKERVSLMIRLDIPGGPEALGDALGLAQAFITDLFQSLSPEDAGYIFGSTDKRMERG